MENSKNTKNIGRNAELSTEVLYQKMGNRWFAFSMVDGEVFVGSISQDDLMREGDLPRSRELPTLKEC